MRGVTKFLLWIYVSDAALELKLSWYVHTRIPWDAMSQWHRTSMSQPWAIPSYAVTALPASPWGLQGSWNALPKAVNREINGRWQLKALSCSLVPVSINTDCRKIPVKPFLLGSFPSAGFTLGCSIPVTWRKRDSETTGLEIPALSGSSSDESEIPWSFS